LIAPRQGAKKGSKQSKATDTITANEANAGPGGGREGEGTAIAGLGGSPGGHAGTATPGAFGAGGAAGNGIGGGLNLTGGGHATIDNTTRTGNHATTTDNDVHGTFSL
jgi:hypothetical protein